MQVEDITGVCLAARRTLEHERDLTISDSLLREVIVDDERVAAGIAEVLADRNTCERCVVTHRGRVGGVGCDNHRIGHRAIFVESVDNRRHGRSLLADCNVDTIYGFAVIVVLLLVDYGVDSDCSLADLTVADDKLTLATTDRNHGIDSLYTCLERLVHRLTENYARCFAFERETDTFPLDRSATVDRLAEHVDHATQHALAHRNRSNFTRALHRHVFCDCIYLIEQHHTDVALFEVEGDTLGAVLKLNELVASHVLKAVDVSHAVADAEHRTDLFKLDFRIDIFELLL